MEKSIPSTIKFRKSIKGIYTDIFPPEGYNLKHNITINEFVNEFLRCDALVCGCQNIFNRYAPFFQKIFYANAILNENLFKKNRINRNKNLVIGWTGNPRRMNKGFVTHVISAVKIAQKERRGIKIKTKFQGSLKSLAKFYQNIDLIIIASKEDAGPSMFMEASLCGIPSISTRIGWPLEVIKDGINGLFVEREVRDIADAIIRLYDNRDLLYNMAARIRNDFISTLGKDVMKHRWEKLFDSVL